MKQHLEDKNWAEIFSSLDHDTNLVKFFIRRARKDKKIPANDLDSMLDSISQYTKSHLEVSPSGINYF